ncbi:MAG TPA: hypothetical protein VFB15_03190 [Candidatus Binataceae bacterium]|nr:hypothetical protein [Candidatus Binataceae bacterium]
MARVTADAVSNLARALYDYDLSTEGAAAVARILGATATHLERLKSLTLDGVQPPFGYVNLIREAECRRAGE